MEGLAESQRVFAGKNDASVEQPPVSAKCGRVVINERDVTRSRVGVQAQS